MFGSLSKSEATCNEKSAIDGDGLNDEREEDQCKIQVRIDDYPVPP